MLNMVITKDGSAIYATSPRKNQLLHISLLQKKLIDFIDVGDMPSDILLDEYKDKLYVANFKSNDISIVIKSCNITAAEIKEVGNGPNKLLLIGEKNYLYSANYLSNDVTVINTMNRSIVKKIPTGSKPSDMILTKDKRNIYVANYGSDFISVINVEKQSVISEIKLNATPLCLGISSDGTILVSVKGKGGKKILLINPVTFSVKDEINTEPYEINNFIDVKCKID